jgi:2-dehydro-3-deoxyphosphogluconate aldolase/(4S)-4-hydroxy-2-oxoglutarate aldolase
MSESYAASTAASMEDGRNSRGNHVSAPVGGRRPNLRAAERPYPLRVSLSLDTGRSSAVADAIRAARLVAVLRGVEPQARLLDLVGDLHDAGVRIHEITFDAPSAASDLAAVADRLAALDGQSIVGAGTIRTIDQLERAVDAGARFGVSPVLDPAVLDAALRRGLPFVPGAYSPTEIDAAWRAGAAFVKIFPGSSLGPDHVRELRGPLPEIELIVTGGVDRTNAVAFLDTGAVAVGIGSALMRMAAGDRRALVEAVAAAGRS